MSIPSVGELAPEIALPDENGTVHRLVDQRGRWTILYFYPEDDTPGCTKEACGFRDLQPQLEGLGVALLGVSRDSLASHDRFIEKFGLPFVLLSDPEAAMLRAYEPFCE